MRRPQCLWCATLNSFPFPVNSWAAVACRTIPTGAPAPTSWSTASPRAAAWMTPIATPRICTTWLSPPLKWTRRYSLPLGPNGTQWWTSAEGFFCLCDMMTNRLEMVILERVKNLPLWFFLGRERPWAPHFWRRKLCLCSPRIPVPQQDSPRHSWEGFASGSC